MVNSEPLRALGDFAGANRPGGCAGEDDFAARARRRCPSLNGSSAFKMTVPSGANRFGKRAFFLGDRFARSHELDVRDADIGDDG